MSIPVNSPERSFRSPLVRWSAVLSVTVGIFLIVTTEILPIGLFTPIAENFRVSAGTAGLMMTIPGIIAAAAAPLVTVSTSRLDRRTMLGILLALLAVADFVAVAAPDYWIILMSRALVGLTIGGFWSIGAGLAARLVPTREAATATAVIFSSVPLGSVLGVPAGTFLGQIAGWRTSFLVMGVLTAVVAIALVAALPALPPLRVTRSVVLMGLLGGTGVRFGVASTFLVVLAHFTAYTYVTPFLQQVTQVSAGTVSAFLLAYGTAGVAGNFLAGWGIARSLRRTFLACGSLLALVLVLLPILGASNGLALGLLVAWGLAYGAVPVCSQSWFVASAADAPEAATVLFTSSFQLTICVGALFGGLIVDAASPSAVMTIGAVPAIVMVVVLWLMRPSGRISERAGAS